MQFQKVFYRATTVPNGPATVLLGADTDPRTATPTAGVGPIVGAASTANQDNILACRVGSIATSNAVTRIAVVMTGPPGAANQNANLFVWEDSTNHWYLMNAAPVALVQNVVMFFDSLAPCEPPATQANQGSYSVSSVDYMLVVAAAAPTAGLYQFSMTGHLAQP